MPEAMHYPHFDIVPMPKGRGFLPSTTMAVLLPSYTVSDRVDAPTRRQTDASRHYTVRMIAVYEPAPQPPADSPGVNNVPALDKQADAWHIFTYYKHRWLVEHFHYVSQSGCGFEQRELGTVERLDVLMAVYNIVNWRLLRLTCENHVNPSKICSRP